LANACVLPVLLVICITWYCVLSTNQWM